MFKVLKVGYDFHFDHVLIYWFYGFGICQIYHSIIYTVDSLFYNSEIPSLREYAIANAVFLSLSLVVLPSHRIKARF